jgi:hypothetical protein
MQTGGSLRRGVSAAGRPCRVALWNVRGAMVGVCLFVGVAPTAVIAQAPTPAPGSVSGSSYLDLGVGLTFGTLGIGGQVSKLLFSHLGVRAGLNYFAFSPNETFNDVQYDAKLRLESVPLLIDVFPMARGAFHVTGGMVINRTQLTGTAIPGPGGTITINNDSYTQAQVGVLNGAFKYPSSGGYLGLGFGTPARKSLMSFSFDIGAIFSQPRVSLTATGAATDTKLATDLVAQQATTQNTANKLRVYPVMSSGILLRL